jgi:hypothetical protein
MSKQVETVQLKQETLLAFTEYIREAEAAMEQTLGGDVPFLWSDRSPERSQQVEKGLTIAHLWSGKRPIDVKDGLIHDWIGATRVSGTTVDKILALVQDYDNHKNVYKPEVMDSKLINRQGNDFQIYLRLRKKKIITVILDTDHDAHYSCVDAIRWRIRSYTTRIAEVEDAGKPTERAWPPDAGYGFLWRLNSYWRFLERDGCVYVECLERDGSVYVECRAISLSRNIPKALRWIIEPMIDKFPRESLRATLEATRRAAENRQAETAPPNGVIGDTMDVTP